MLSHYTVKYVFVFLLFYLSYIHFISLVKSGDRITKDNETWKHLENFIKKSDEVHTPCLMWLRVVLVKTLSPEFIPDWYYNEASNYKLLANIIMVGYRENCKLQIGPYATY